MIIIPFLLDAVICGVAMICSAPFFYAVLVLSLGSIYTIYILVFFALWFLNMIWALIGDILLVSYISFSCRQQTFQVFVMSFKFIIFDSTWQYVVVPSRRATAATLQILVCHIFGDASSPFIIGLVLHQHYNYFWFQTWLIGWIVFLLAKISDALKPTIESKSEVSRNYKSLEYGLYVVLVIELVGGFFFLVCSRFLVKDRTKAALAVTSKHSGAPVLIE